MVRPRVIPTLLLENGGLIKTTKFKKPVYIGDPINAVKIFNDKEVDELILLDVTASMEDRKPNFEQIEEIVSESFMPLGYGGGIRSVSDIEKLFKIGIEKASLNTAAVENPTLVTEAAEVFGSQSIVISIDVKKNLFGKKQVFIRRGSKNTKLDPVEFAKKAESLGAGEIYLTSIDREGSMQGYDLDLIKAVSNAVSIPVIANGGAGKVEHFSEALHQANASAVTAGSMFVFHGPLRGILINYPEQEELKEKLYTT